MIKYQVGYTRIPKHGVRRLHIGGREYLYKIFPWRAVFYLEKMKVVADLPDITGLTTDIIDRGRWKKTSDGFVTPAMCKKFLEKILHKDR